jgi:hypothetical protein
LLENVSKSRRDFNEALCERLLTKVAEWTWGPPTELGPSIGFLLSYGSET